MNIQNVFLSIWKEITNNTQKLGNFKRQKIPIARIKKVMKTDVDVNMISNDSPIVLAKACELFIIDLSLRAQFFSQNKDKELKKQDVIMAIANIPHFEFLKHLIPSRVRMKEVSSTNYEGDNEYYMKVIDEEEDADDSRMEGFFDLHEKEN